MAYVVTVLGRQVTSGQVSTETINEISGYADSRIHPRTIWAEEDSQAQPWFYAFDYSGQVKHIARLTGSNIVRGQWEDIAIDDKNGYIWIANCGNNAATRNTFEAWRVREPTTLVPNAVTDVAHSGAFKFGWTGYETGGRNCETVMVDTNGRLYFVNKETTQTGNELNHVGLWAAPVNLAPWPTVNWLVRLTPDNWCRQGGVAGGDWARDNHSFYIMNNNDNGYRFSTSPPYNLIETFVIRQPLNGAGNTQTAESLAVSSDCTFLIRGSEGANTEILKATLDNPPFGGDPGLVGRYLVYNTSTVQIAIKQTSTQSVLVKSQ